MTSDRHGGLPALAVFTIFGYGAVATLFPPYEWPIRVATALPCIALFGLAVRRGWHRPQAQVMGGSESQGPPWRIGLAVWVVLIGAAVAFQLFNFFAWPRTVYPTLSSLASQIFHLHPVRAAAFGLWLWLGWYLLDR